MKRALAERAKQQSSESGHAGTNGLGPAPVSSGPPPRKIPRVANNDDASQLQQQPVKQEIKAEPITIPSRASSSTPRASPSGTPRERRTSMKRQRSNAALATEEEEDDSSGFYLKHQNKALASELKGLQYQLRLLEKERDLRRQQCQEAGQALQSLQNTWTQMEVALQLGTPSGGPESAEPQKPPAETSVDGGTRNTGSGKSVELVGSLLDSLASLGKPAVATLDEGDTPVDTAVQTELHDMKQAAFMISQRCGALQKWLWTLLERVNSSERLSSVVATAELEGQVASLQSQCRDLEARIKELANTRDEAVSSDRRVRRGLYRLAAGRMKLEEVLKAVEDDDKDGAGAMMAMEVAEEVASSNEKPVSSTVAGTVGGDPEEGEVVDGAQVASLKKQLQDLEEIAKSRESQIEQLLKEREENAKRINSLSLPKSSDRASISEEDIKRSPLFTDTATKLVTSERQLKELQTRMEKLMQKYATAKGDAELATKTLDEHMANFKKRWAELSGANKDDGDFGDLYDDAQNSKSSKNANGASLLDSSQQAKRIVELEHKLKQALESVRQADLVRVSLTEAQNMNDTLLQQLEDFKSKYAAVMAGRAASRSASETTLSSKDKSPSVPVSAEKAEKLYKDNRRMKKELDVAMLGKQSAKAKQDKAEKERDDLLETNSRLVKQNMEKDDMNAKSLSTILHLKSLTEQAEREKVAREQEAKSAEQVALAARLAENAKDRVAEEALKEKKLLEDRVAELEKECERVKHEKEVTDGALAQTKAEMSSLETSVGAIKNRSEELTAESAKLQEEKRRLVESLAVAQREAAEAAKKVMHLRASGGGGGDSEFTADQLATQVSVLKGRLACPVCNHRDKECILLRCCHMFCKPCVEENVKNRSRKCPACGQRFDNKDVHDVWL